MTETVNVPAEIEALGPTAVQEYSGARDSYKPGLVEYARNLPTLPDDAFMDAAASAIFDAALVNSFRGNWEHEHFKATACHKEAQRRHVAAGHDEGCRGGTSPIFARNCPPRS